MTHRAPILSLRHLTCHFGDKVAVNNLDLDVYAGEVFGMLGHNGAGKTTTVRLLNGILRPSAGQMEVMGLNPTTEGSVLRRHTGVLTETPALEEQLTARDNLCIYASLYNVPHSVVASKVQRLLDTFDLAEHADKRVGSYSKGMKQRLALARALLHDPQLLFLDEPTEGLDPVAAHHVRELIVKLSQEERRTIFLCTHNLVEAQSLCDRIAVLKHGRLQTIGTPGDLIQQLADSRSLRLDIELSPSTLPTALELLGALTDIRASQVRNNMVTIQGAEYETIPTLVEKLVVANIPVYRVIPHEPSLEDVYFALHDKEVVQNKEEIHT